MKEGQPRPPDEAFVHEVTCVAKLWDGKESTVVYRFPSEETKNIFLTTSWPLTEKKKDQ